MSRLCNLYQRRAEQGPTSKPLRVLLAGSDKLVQLFLRPFLEQIARRPRGWAASGFAFYLLPLGKRNDLANHIGSIDPTYRSLFLANDWIDLWQRAEAVALTASDTQLVTTRILRYLNEAVQSASSSLSVIAIYFFFCLI